MAANAILDFQIREISLADSVWGARLIIVLNVVKISLSVVEILPFFEFSRWPPLPALIFEITKFYWLMRSRGSRLKFRQNRSIGCNDIKIFRFFKMAVPPSWIVEFGKFYWLTVSGGPDALLYQISSKTVVLLQRYCDSSNLQDGRR